MACTSRLTRHQWLDRALDAIRRELGEIDENGDGRYTEHVDELYYDTSNVGYFDRPNGLDDDGDGLVDEADENDIIISHGANQNLDLNHGDRIQEVKYTLSTSDKPRALRIYQQRLISSLSWSACP